jgi:hypothetical protein
VATTAQPDQSGGANDANEPSSNGRAATVVPGGPFGPGTQSIFRFDGDDLGHGGR